MGKIVFLLWSGLFFLLSCSQTPHSLRLLSDSAWLWKATELYNRERAGQKPLIVFDYQENIRSWLINPAYKEANIIISDQSMAHLGLKYLPLDVVNTEYKKRYGQLKEYQSEYFTPIFFEAPLYLLPKSKKWENVNILDFQTVFDLSAAQTSSIAKSPLLLRELLQLSSQPTAQLRSWRQELEQLEPLKEAGAAWYLQLQRPDPQLPIVPISLENYHEFSEYGKDDYRPILLTNDSLAWQPRKLGLIALSGEQSRKEKQESKNFFSWISSYDTQKNLALLTDTPGMLGAWSIFPEVNEEWVSFKAPELNNLFKKE